MAHVSLQPALVSWCFNHSRVKMLDLDEAGKRSTNREDQGYDKAEGEPEVY